MNEVHRQLLLSAFSELWVEYLTKVEALRVSIGLEAYAQRDPLVQYKGRASEMFAQLLEDVRGLVIGRAFASRPRGVEITPIETTETARPARHRCKSAVIRKRETSLTIKARFRISFHRGRVWQSCSTKPLPLNRYFALPKVELTPPFGRVLRLTTMLDIARQHGVTVPVSMFNLSGLVQVQDQDPMTFTNFLDKFKTLRLFYQIARCH
jgi:hypothetical protein